MQCSAVLNEHVSLAVKALMRTDVDSEEFLYLLHISFSGLFMGDWGSDRPDICNGF